MQGGVHTDSALLFIDACLFWAACQLSLPLEGSLDCVVQILMHRLSRSIGNQSGLDIVVGCEPGKLRGRVRYGCTPFPTMDHVETSGKPGY